MSSEFFCNSDFNVVGTSYALEAKQVMELVGSSQSTFGDMVSELGLAAAMRPDAEYTLLAPLNVAFNGESDHNVIQVLRLFFLCTPSKY